MQKANSLIVRLTRAKGDNKYMNSEKKPPAPQNNKGAKWHKKKNRRRPYYNNKNKGTQGSESSQTKEPKTLPSSSQERESIEESANVDIEIMRAIEEENEKTIFGESISDDEISITVENEEDIKYASVAGIRFKANGKVYYFDKGELSLKSGSYVIVETARGLEFGEVAFGDKIIKESSLVLPLRPVIRVATQEDIERNKQNKAKENEAFKICLEKIAKHELDMKLIEAQYSFDNSKLLFYFTSASRVDFRELVKDLASIFKTRIELRQIGIRDEAKLLGGLGVCGRALCCSTFLSDFAQVSIRMAKEQSLSLNSGKISGACGRLMCCLQYEYSTYLKEGSITPPVDSTVKTKDGIGVVTEANVLTGIIKVKLKDKPDAAPEKYSRDDVTLISRPSKKESD